MFVELYQRYSRHLMVGVVLSLPWLLYQAESMPANNDIETWLPIDSDVRATYEQFKRDFGAEELILIGLNTEAADAELVEAVAARVEGLPTVRQCWTPDRLRHVMSEIGVQEDEIDDRLHGFAVSDDGMLEAVVALLSKDGLADRAGTVESVRKQLDYCQLSGDDVRLAGSPVVIAELDRLGGHANNRRFFMITLAISLVLLYYQLREWRLTGAVLLLTVWAINATMAIIGWAGGEMNFILGALSVMVMVFTLAISIHFLHYYDHSRSARNPLAAAMQLAWKPCLLATATTTIGLLSLTVSDIGPVRQFGYAASLGAVVALFTGLGLTPALLVVFPNVRFRRSSSRSPFMRIISGQLNYSGRVVIAATVLVVTTGFGLRYLESRIDPHDFLPKGSKVLADLNDVQKRLTALDSFEAVVDFEDSPLTFVEKLDRVREWERRLREHPSVRYTMSAATFLPTEMPDGALATTRVLQQADARRDSSEFLAEGERMWRISMRVDAHEAPTKTQLVDDLRKLVHAAPMTFTGVAPLLDHAQRSIFDGFWKSFSMAFVIISGVMIVSLRSLKIGLLAMIPNLTPICIVFGLLGWMQVPVDIGMMMTGSIALGIAVDGTFHFLVRYQEHLKHTADTSRASKVALFQTAAPIFQAAIISSLGMLALTLSSFTPTMRFGLIMAAMLTAALVGDLGLLPCLLYLRRRRPTRQVPAPKFLKHHSTGRVHRDRMRATRRVIE